MSDKISSIDRVYLSEIPELFNGNGWHKKGIPTKTFTEESLKEVLFEHTYEPAGVLLSEKVKAKESLVLTGPKGEKYRFVKTVERYAIASDSGLPVGNAIGERYHRPSNLALFKLMKDALAGSEYEIVSCGTIDGRQEFFIDAKAKNKKVAGRDYSPYVGLHNFFGGLGKLLTCGHFSIMQCGNTTILFIREASKSEDSISTRNTLNVEMRLPEIKKAIELQHGVQGQFIRAFEASAKVKVSKDEARFAFVGFEVEPGKLLATRSVNRVNRELELFTDAKQGNEGKNASDVFSALTDVYTHENAGSIDPRWKDSEQEASRVKQWYSSERGSGSKVKAELASKLMVKGEFNDEYFTSLKANGEKVIAANRASTQDKDKDALALLN